MAAGAKAGRNGEGETIRAMAARPKTSEAMTSVASSCSTDVRSSEKSSEIEMIGKRTATAQETTMAARPRRDGTRGTIRANAATLAISHSRFEA